MLNALSDDHLLTQHWLCLLVKCDRHVMQGNLKPSDATVQKSQDQLFILPTHPLGEGRGGE